MNFHPGTPPACPQGVATLGGAADVTDEGDVRVTVTWTGSTPPSAQYVDIKITSQALWQVGYTVPILDLGIPSHSADNGFKDDPKYSTTNFGGSETSLGTHIVRMDVSSNNTFTKTIHLKTHVVVVPVLSSAAFGTVLGVSASADPRSAMITCPALEDGGNYHAASDGTRQLNVRNIDGSMVVDSVVNFGTPVWGDPDSEYSWWFGPQSLDALTVGFDTTTTLLGFPTNIRVDWDNGGDGNALITEFDASPTYIILRDSGYGKLLTPTTITAKVKDLRAGQEATAENTYTIRYHWPVENVKRLDNSDYFAYDLSFGWSSEVQANQGTTLYMVQKDAVQAKIDCDSGQQFVATFTSGVIGSGMAGFICINPELYWVPILSDMFFNAAGMGMTDKTGTPDVPVTMPYAPGQADFDHMRDEQVEINNGQIVNGQVVKSDGTLDESVDFPEELRFDGIDPQQLQTDGTYYNKIWNHAVLKVMVHKGQKYNHFLEAYKVYDTHGYVGPGYNWFVYGQRMTEVVSHWALVQQN